MRVTAEREKVKETYNNWVIYWQGAPWIESIIDRAGYQFMPGRCHFFLTKKNDLCNNRAIAIYRSNDGPEFMTCGRHMLRWLYSPGETKRTHRHIRRNPPPWMRL